MFNELGGKQQYESYLSYQVSLFSPATSCSKQESTHRYICYICYHGEVALTLDLSNKFLLMLMKVCHTVSVTLEIQEERISRMTRDLM